MWKSTSVRQHVLGRDGSGLLKRKPLVDIADAVVVSQASISN